jgi:hypothetical protein
MEAESIQLDQKKELYSRKKIAALQSVKAS